MCNPHHSVLGHRLYLVVGLLLVLGSVIFGNALAGAQTISLNEIRIDQPSTDNDEYFELAGTPGASLDGLTYVVIGDSSAGSGSVEAVVNLGGLAVAGDGFFVAAEGTFSLGTPDLFTNLNFENSDNVTHLLVRDFSGSNGDDLDTNDDGVLDTTPWSELVDCVALVESFSSGEQIYCTATNGPDVSFVPAHSIRCATGWEIGIFDPAVGVDTPGSANPCVEPQTSAVLSEVRIDQSGTDDDEFFELEGTPSGSLDGFTYLVIGDSSAGSGAVEAVVDLSGQTIPASGFFVAAEGSFTLGTADFTTSLNFENSDNVTHLLVRDFSGASGDDLDTNDDGVLDVTPWSELVSCLGLVETVGSGDRIYCATTNGPDGSFVPAHSFLCPAGWQIGSFAPDGGDTPGSANTCTPPEIDVALSEIRIDQPSSDNDEYFELAGTPGGLLDGLTYLVIGDSSAGSGAVEAVVNLGGQAIAASGFFVAAEGSFSLGSADFTANLNFENSDNVTHLLVRDFTGSSGQDLDTNDDGVLDATPWSEIVDCVGLVETVGSGDRIYCDSTVGPDGTFVPAHSIRCPLGYQIGPFNPSGVDTPGAPNVCSAPELVINEVDYDQPSTDTGEFVEILNTGSAAVNLDSFAIQVINGNGGGASVSRTLDLPAVVLQPGAYFVVCANAANVVNCDLDVSPDSNLIQNGSPDAVALVVDGAVVDTVSYEGNTGAPYTEGSGDGLFDSGSTGQDFKGISRSPDGIDTDQNNVDFAFACITPGGANTSRDINCTAQGPAFEIFEIQGTGAASPFVGAPVATVANVVTALDTDGFFIQTPTDRSDGNALSSDGIFVFTGGAPAVAVGDLVDVSGTVVEFFGFTEFSGGTTVSVVGSGPLPAPVAFDASTPSSDPAFPSCSDNNFECFEGMLVEITAGTVAASNQRFGSDPAAEIHVTAHTGRVFREPGIEFPGEVGLPVWDGNPEAFELDPDALGLPNQVILAGSTFGATGVIGFEFNHYELWPSALNVTPATLPVPVRAAAADELTVGSLNLFRLFDNVDDPNDGGRNDAVVSLAEYERRRAKFATYIVEVLGSPDILAVQEAEKLGVLEDLAGDVQALDPGVSYSAILVEGNDIGTIDVGFLVRDNIAVSAVTQLGKDEIFDFDGSLLHDRPPLLIDAVCNGTFPISVMSVHIRSLGGIDDPSGGDRVRRKRLAQAESIATMVQDIQSTDPDVYLVVTGDFNAFEFTDGYVDVTGIIKGSQDPLGSLLPGLDLVDPDLTDLVLEIPAEERYSFIFRDSFNPVRSRGDAQVLDHALTSAALDALVQGFEYGRGNADAAVDLINDDSAANLPLRSSDHDGLVVFILKDEDQDGVPDAEDVCLGTTIPEGVPTVGLGTNRFALVDSDGVFDTVSPGGQGPGASFTIEDTAGCSCEQIITAQGLGEGHTKFGCSLGEMEDWVTLVNP